MTTNKLVEALLDDTTREQERKTKPLKWARMDLEDTEPDVRSEDGRFEITPLYIGRETPQRWVLKDTQSGKTVETNTLAQAKERADRLSGHIAQKKSWVAGTEEEFQRNYDYFVKQADVATDEYAKKIALRGAEQVRRNAESAGVRLSQETTPENC